MEPSSYSITDGSYAPCAHTRLSRHNYDDRFTSLQFRIEGLKDLRALGGINLRFRVTATVFARALGSGFV